MRTVPLAPWAWRWATLARTHAERALWLLKAHEWAARQFTMEVDD